jgi:hypothetical protein
MVASSLEALRALLGGRAGALDSTVSVLVVDDMLSNWAMSVPEVVVVLVVVAVLEAELGKKLLLLYDVLLVWSCPSRVRLCGMKSTWLFVRE